MRQEHPAFGRLALDVVLVQTGAADGVQVAVRMAGEAVLRARAAAGVADGVAGQAGGTEDGRHLVVGEENGAGACGETCWTVSHTALVVQVEAGVALCGRKKQNSV